MEVDITKQITKKLESLLEQFLPSEHVQKAKPYFLKLLSSRLSHPVLNEVFIKKSIISQLSQPNTDKFQDLYLKLIKLKSKFKRKILYILSKLKENPESSLLLEKTPPLFTKKPKPARILITHKPPGSITILEPALISEILSILSNKPGKYLLFDQINEKYDLYNSSTLAPYLQITSKISELG